MNQSEPLVLIELNRANVLLNESNCEGAIVICDRLIGIDNCLTNSHAARVSAYRLRARAYEKSGKIDLAIADYELVRKIESSDLYSADRLCWLYYQRGEFEKSKFYVSAVIALAPVVEANMYELRANILLKLKSYADCLLDCDKAIALGGKNMLTYVHAVAASIASRQYEKSVFYATDALKLAPQCGQLFFARGLAFSNLSEHEKAVGDFKSAVKKNKTGNEIEFLSKLDVSICYKLMLSCLFNLKRFADVIRVCDREILKCPKDSILLRTRAEALSKLRKYRDAIETFEFALLHEKPARQRSRINSQIAVCYSRLGDALSAVKHYDVAISLDSNNALACNNKAWTLAHLGELEGAAIEIERAIFLQPQCSNYLSTRGLIFFRMGKNDLAINDFEQALKTNPDITEAFVFLAAIAGSKNVPDRVAKKLLRANKFELPAFSTITVF